MYVCVCMCVSDHCVHLLVLTLSAFLWFTRGMCVYYGCASLEVYSVCVLQLCLSGGVLCVCVTVVLLWRCTLCITIVLLWRCTLCITVVLFWRCTLCVYYSCASLEVFSLYYSCAFLEAYSGHNHCPLIGGNVVSGNGLHWSFWWWHQFVRIYMHPSLNAERSSENGFAFIKEMPLWWLQDKRELCAECGKGGQLLLCGTCSLVYHLDCLSPPLVTAPASPWSCPACIVSIAVHTLLPPHTASASTHCFCLHTLLPPPHPRQRDHSLLGFMKGRWSLSLPGLLEHGFCPHRETMACWVLWKGGGLCHCLGCWSMASAPTERQWPAGLCERAVVFVTAWVVGAWLLPPPHPRQRETMTFLVASFWLVHCALDLAWDNVPQKRPLLLWLWLLCWL